MGNPEQKTNGLNGHKARLICCGTDGPGMQDIPGLVPTSERLPGQNGSGEKEVLGVWKFDPEIRNYVFIEVSSE